MEAISEVGLFKIELEEKCPVAESGSNLGVVSISSEDVEDRLLLLSVSLLFFEDVWAIKEKQNNYNRSGYYSIRCTSCF